MGPLNNAYQKYLNLKLFITVNILGSSGKSKLQNIYIINNLNSTFFSDNLHKNSLIFHISASIWAHFGRIWSWWFPFIYPDKYGLNSKVFTVFLNIKNKWYVIFITKGHFLSITSPPTHTEGLLGTIF